MFADPQSITYATVAKSLPAISRSADQSEYKLFDSGGVVYDLRLGHTFKSRSRAFARIQRDSFSSDPLVPANNLLASMSATISFDYPNFGLTVSDIQNLGAALTGWATAANILKLVSGET